MPIRIPKPWRNRSHRDPNNPDIKKKRQAVLVDVQSKTARNIVRTTSGDVLFEHGMAVLPDDTRAEDIHAELMQTKALHPGHYALTRHRESVNTDRTHRFFLGSMPEMPWKREKE